MAHTSLPAEQRDRLKALHEQQRRAVTQLAAAEVGVAHAERVAADAHQAVADSKRKAEQAYRELLTLIGPTAAEQLTGRAAPGRRSNSSARHADRRSAAASPPPEPTRPQLAA